MREPLLPFRGANRLNYLCILASELMGVGHLRDLPALLSGFNSVMGALHQDVAQAIVTLRVCGFAPTTHRELRLIVDAYLNHHRNRDDRNERAKKGEKDSFGEGKDGAGVDKVTDDEGDGYAQLYEIDKDFSIRRRWETVVPAPIVKALQCLIQTPEVRHRAAAPLHDGSLVASIRRKNDDYRGDIEPFRFEPAPPPAYDLARVGREPGLVTWQELIDMAVKFDSMDVEAGRQAESERSWFHRLHDKNGEPTAVLLGAVSTGLAPVSGIDLKGLKHLIGLPGAGKTTILFLLAACMAERDMRTCFLLPSIEVSTGFIETLERYGVRAGLLSGQGESSRTRHILNFSTAIAKENNGFAVTRPSARFFATNCALAGFASEEEDPFPHARPPCNDLQQRMDANSKPQARRCALSGSCARQQAERELIESNIWVGHVLSLDRSVAPLFADFDTKHFEFVARTFDLVVVDECDGAQADLDDRGTPIMKLFGDENALWATLISDLHAPIAKGRNAFVSGKDMPSLIEMTGRFGQATNRLSGRIQHLSAQVSGAYQSKLLTSLSIIADMFPYGGDAGDEDELESHAQARHGVERLWDAAVKTVAFRPSLKDDDEEMTDLDREIPEIASLLAMPEPEVTAIYGSLHSAIESWDRDADEQAIEKIAQTLQGISSIPTSVDGPTFIECCGLLTSVSLVVLQHFGLAPHLRLLNSMDLVSDNVFESRPSRDQLAILPESLTGKLSGIRFTVSDEGNINITHIGIQGTPRRLFQRMHELGRSGGGGAAFLLTSATSLLEASPRFHINEGPHYVLRRPNAGLGWQDSRYEFLPLQDPHQSDKFLRFSGSKLSQRERVLKAMVDGLLDGGSLSRVSNAMRTNDVVDGVGRKIGLVVNSYEQCELLYAHIQSSHSDWRGRVRYLRRAGGSGDGATGGHPDHAVTASEVESLGFENDWDILIFPMSAIGRGVNIVYKQGPRMDKAMIGSLYFMTRPHPRQDDLGLIQGLVGRRSEAFDEQTFPDVQTALSALIVARKQAVEEAKKMLRMPLVASRLGPYAKPFVADQMIIILQTIGRAMRGDCPAFVYFVDAAWAPSSARGENDTDKSSMLIMMQNILQDCLTHPDPTMRECYANLYTSFAQPMTHILNLKRA